MTPLTFDIEGINVVVWCTLLSFLLE